MTIRFTVAGRVGIEADNVVLGLTGLGRAGRLALAYLVCERHRPVPRDELADVLWGEDFPAHGTRCFEGCIADSGGPRRGRPGPSKAMVTAFGTYQLRLPPDAVVDVEEAVANRNAAVDASAVNDPTRAFERASAAVAVASRQFVPGATGSWVERRTSFSSTRSRFHPASVSTRRTRLDRCGSPTPVPRKAGPRSLSMWSPAVFTEPPAATLTPLREIYKRFVRWRWRGRFNMQKVIRCDCGFEATGISDDDLVPVAQAHARAAHDTEVSADLVLALARPHPGPAIRPTKGET